MNVTVPVGPPDPMTFAVNVISAPNVDGLLLDATLVESVGSLMVSVAVAVCTSPPLVPVIVNGKLPIGVVRLDLTVSSEDPDVVTDGGVKFAVAAVGNPLTLKSTAPANPSDGATV